ncbi:hypothetical protein [Lyngbya sp. CCY1209]|uniref:hypothetical protein n=1 Tax=Lyngbya sp. CCY1209 TaxID=2886103 RepID=UPI002D215BC2|nr:hypothetical protein [Lyngbya sp. CCY1209]MEB3886158.1 hypothetical protein [Lyngbya sp. CCY1209]
MTRKKTSCFGGKPTGFRNPVEQPRDRSRSGRQTTPTRRDSLNRTFPHPTRNEPPDAPSPPARCLQSAGTGRRRQSDPDRLPWIKLPQEIAIADASEWVIQQMLVDVPQSLPLVASSVQANCRDRTPPPRPPSAAIVPLTPRICFPPIPSHRSKSRLYDGQQKYHSLRLTKTPENWKNGYLVTLRHIQRSPYRLSPVRSDRPQMVGCRPRPVRTDIQQRNLGGEGGTQALSGTQDRTEPDVPLWQSPPRSSHLSAIAGGFRTGVP